MVRLTEILTMKSSGRGFTFATFGMGSPDPADDPFHFRREP
jgi:hypothetical protein